MGSITIPVRVRVGSADEQEIGTVTAASTSELMQGLAALLRTTADEVEQAGQEHRG